MRRALLLGLLVAACGSKVLRWDAVPTDRFPESWSGQRLVRPQPVALPPAPPPAAAPQVAVAQAPANRFAGSLLAVLEFNNKLKGNDREQVDAPYFSNVVRGEVKRGVPGLKVMTRENVLVMLQAQGKTLADCEGECEVETGRRLGADLVVSGDLLKIGSNLKLDLRLHETKNGQLINGVRVTAATVDELEPKTVAAIEELIRPLR